MTEGQKIEESLYEVASKLIEQAERVADELYLAAEDVRQRRLVARRSAPQAHADTDTDTVKPVALEGLSEAEAVMDYKVALLQGIKWLLEGYPKESEGARVRTGVHFIDLLGENVWNALTALWAE